MYESHTIKLTTAGKKFWGTRKTTMRIVLIDKPVSLGGGYWDGGSRDSYYGKSLGGSEYPLSYPTAPPQFGGGVAPEILPVLGEAICKSAIFRGKDAGVTAYVTCLDGWMDARYGEKKV
jgi:hypothetical protein